MAQFKYNAFFTYKASELIVHAKKRLEEARDNLYKAENDLKDDATAEDLRIIKQVDELLRQVSVPVIHPRISRDHQPKKSLIMQYKREVERWILTIKALEAQDPHRQYRLDMEDIGDFGIYRDED